MGTTNCANDITDQEWIEQYHNWQKVFGEYEINKQFKKTKIYNFLKTYEQQKTYVQKGKVL